MVSPILVSPLILVKVLQYPFLYTFSNSFCALATLFLVLLLSGCQRSPTLKRQRRFISNISCQRTPLVWDLLGGARKQIRAGLATAQSRQYHTNAELMGVARSQQSGIRAEVKKLILGLWAAVVWWGEALRNYDWRSWTTCVESLSD